MYVVKNFADSDLPLLDRALLSELLLRLSPRDRDIIWLWAVEGYSLPEIGEIVWQKYGGEKPLSVRTINYHKDRIIKKLKRWILTGPPMTRPKRKRQNIMLHKATVSFKFHIDLNDGGSLDLSNEGVLLSADRSIELMTMINKFISNNALSEQKP